MNLREYIIEHGVSDCAERWDVSIHTINSWRFENRKPSIEKAKEIIRETDGDLGWDEIFGSPEVA